MTVTVNMALISHIYLFSKTHLARFLTRSTGSLSKMASSTLPRNFGRSKSAVDTPLCQMAKNGIMRSNGVVGKGLKGTKRLSSSTTSTHKPGRLEPFDVQVRPTKVLRC